MPFLLVVIGMIMIVSALRNTHAQMAAQLRGDFIPFGMWTLAIGSVGAIGYIPELRRFSHYFMALIIIGMIISNRGFFAKLSEAIKLGPISPTPPATAPGGGPPTSSPATPTTPAAPYKNPATGRDDRSLFGSPAGPGLLNNPELQSKFNALMNVFGKMLFLW